MLRRILSLTIKEFIHLRNDWMMPAFMLFGGALELLLVGWSTSRPLTNLPMMILDQDQTPATRQVITAIENTGTFDIQEYVQSYGPIEDAMSKGKINAAVIFPPDFGAELNAYNGKPTLSVILNGTESTPASGALRAIEGVVSSLNQKILIQRLNLNPAEFSSMQPSLRVWFNEALTEAYYTTPAELGLMLEFTVLLFAALSFSRERELGTLEQLLVMPFSSFEIIVGKSIPVVIVGMFDFLMMLTMVHFAFGVPVRGSLLLLIILAFGYLFVELSKGLVISVLSKNQHQAFLLVMMIGMVDFMFTGYAAPVESMPKVIQFVANFIPAHHWLNILRGILLKGSGLNILWPQVLMLMVLGLLITPPAFRFVRRALN